jgi:hypothetical protein
LRTKQQQYYQVVQLLEVSVYFFEQMKVTRDRYKLLPRLANQATVLGHKRLQPMTVCEPSAVAWPRCPRHRQAAFNTSPKRPALSHDLRVARMLQRTHSLRAFLAVRKGEEFFFQTQVLFAGLR